MGELQWMAARLSYGLVNYRHPKRAKVLREVFRSHNAPSLPRRHLNVPSCTRRSPGAIRYPVTWRRQAYFLAERRWSCWPPRLANVCISSTPLKGFRTEKGISRLASGRDRWRTSSLPWPMRLIVSSFTPVSFRQAPRGWRIFGSHAFTLTSISMTAHWRLYSGSGQG